MRTQIVHRFSTFLTKKIQESYLSMYQVLWSATLVAQFIET